MHKKVCIVTSDIMGPVTCGGVGSAFYSLAICLTELGHSVEILWVDCENVSPEKVKFWTAEYANLGISLRKLRIPKRLIEGDQNLTNCYLVFEQLKILHFDFLHFPDMKGLAYYVLLAKKQGLYFSKTRIVLHLHGTLDWHKKGNDELYNHEDELITDFFETQCLKLATDIVSPSQYMLDYQNVKGEVIPHCPIPNPAHKEILSTKESIIFFGRLEARKGLELFCDLLDELTPSLLNAKRITFLGKIGFINGQNGRDYIKSRAKNWNFSYEIISDLDQAAALSYVREKSHLVVLPSLHDNSPMTVFECLSFKIPFIVTLVGGVSEMLQNPSQNTFLPDLKSLRNCFLSALKNPPVAAPSSSFKCAASKWEAFHAQTGSVAENSAFPKPMVSVCLISNNRPEFLTEAKKSLDKQTYKNFEVILLEANGQTPGAARNLAAKKAAGEYLLFMDDDNLALPKEIETFVKAAMNTGADVYTCPFQRFKNHEHQSVWVPIGSLVGLGLTQNVFGDTNFFIKKSVFSKLEGFNETALYGEDWEFLSRAALQGFKLEVVPEILFLYREHSNNFSNSVKIKKASRERLGPFFNLLDPRLHKFAEMISQKAQPLKQLGVTPTESEILLSAEDLVANVTNSHNANVSLQPNGLLIHGFDVDPWIFIDLPEKMNGPLALEIWVTSKTESQLKIYWTRENQFSEELTTFSPLQKGISKQTFVIPDSRRRGGLRLDFGETPQDFFLHQIRAVAVNNNADPVEKKYSHLLTEIKSLETQITPAIILNGTNKDLDEIKTSNCKINLLTSFELIAENDDPQIIFPEFKRASTDVALIFRNNSGNHRVYWRHDYSDDFCESNSAIFDQEILIQSERPIKQLRIDPVIKDARFDFDLIYLTSDLI